MLMAECICNYNKKEVRCWMVPVDEKVKKIVAEQLGVDEEEVTSEASFVDDLGADSLDTVELVMAFEEEFSIEIPDPDLVLLWALSFSGRDLIFSDYFSSF